MTQSRYARTAAVGLAGVIAGTLALTACGSDNNATTTPSSTSSSTSPATTSAGSTECPTGTLSAEGSTAQANAMTEWVKAYGAKCSGTTINYNATGSGKGITQFNAGQVDFAGTDSALNATKGEVAAGKKRCGGNDAWNLPMAVGPIAVAYNLGDVKDLTLNGEVAAKIFTGAVTKWNDPAIAALNSGAKLPATAIKVFARSDDSGTTENFEKYLAAAGNGAFKAAPAKKWGGVGEGREKSSGVQEAVKSTAGGIGYMEWSFARDAKLGVAKIDAGAGAIELSGESAGKALEAATIAGTGNDLPLKLDYATKKAGVYPIVLVTYEVVCSKGLTADKAKLVKSFLTYTSSDEAQQLTAGIGYAPLPSTIREKVATAVAALS